MAITNARMQMRRGLEADFDPYKMQPGEWAVSLDKKYVRMCFSVGVCVRMATYDAFEEDMAQIEEILSKCETIEEAVAKINTEVSANAKAVAEYTEQAKKYRDEAKAFRDEAESIAGIGVATRDKAGIVKPDGETITVDEDGTIHASEGTTDYVDLENKPQIEGVELSGNKTLSELGIASADDLSTANENINVNSEKILEVEVKVDTIIEKAELNIKNSASGENIHLTDSANSKVVEFGLYGKATQDGEPTTDNPIEIVVSGSDGSVEVVSCGKNLLENTAESQTSYGIEFTVNTDGSVRASGTQTGSPLGFTLLITDNWGLQDGTEYILSGANGTSGRTETLVVVDRTLGSNVAEVESGNEAHFTYVSGHTYEIKVELRSTGTTHDVTFYPMIRLASDTDDTYEPYKETVSTISTPNGIAGIKVDSGGNYTDENGQQWICDEVVKYADGSGKRIQRIGKAVFDGSADEGWYIDGRGRWITFSLSEEGVNIENINKSANALCTSYQIKTPAQTYEQIMGVAVNNKTVIVYDSNHSGSDKASWTAYLAENPMILYYELATPIITYLTAKEIAEIEKLHTFYPVTNISNDADCGMAVTYMADAKNYIDNRLALLETALVNSI